METFKLLTQISFVASSTNPQTSPATYDVLTFLLICLFIISMFALLFCITVILKKKSFQKYSFAKRILTIDNKLNLIKCVTAAIICICVIFLAIAITINGKNAYAKDNSLKNNNFPQNIQAIVDSETGEVSIDDVLIGNELDNAMALFSISTTQIEYSNNINIFIDDNLVYNEISGTEIKFTQAYHVDSGDSVGAKFYFEPDINLIGQVLNVEISYYKASLLSGSVQTENDGNSNPAKDVFVRYCTQDNSVYDYYSTYTDDYGDYKLYAPFEALGWMNFSKDGYVDGYISSVITDKPFMQMETIVLKVDNDDEYLTMTLHNSREDYSTFFVYMPDNYYKPDLWLRVKLEDGTWSSWKDLSEVGYRETNLTRNQVIQFKGINPAGWTRNKGTSAIFRVKDSDFTLSGNLMSLIAPGAIEVPSHSFFNLFTDIDADQEGDLLTFDKDLFTQCKKLNYSCFEEMFTFCQKLRLPKDFVLPAEKMARWCYMNMFNSCEVLTIPEGFALPSTDLAEYCYNGMFANCHHCRIPEGFVLPAENLAPHCYQAMFTSIGLEYIPSTFKLHAMNLADNCYDFMFARCPNLKLSEGLELPATKLATGCYLDLFRECGSIEYLPKSLKLDAPILAEDCYFGFFYGCTNLKETIDLPATVLAEDCYGNFYLDCVSLQVESDYVLPAETLAESCYSNMFGNCISMKNAPIIKGTNINLKYCMDHMFQNCKNIHSVDISCVTKFDPRSVEDWLLDAGTDGEEPIINIVKCGAEIAEKVKKTLPNNWDVVVV